jgi:hypothetical protein
MWGQDERNAYTFDEKGMISAQSVKIGDFEDKKEVKVWRIKQNVVILQPKTNKRKVKARII